MANGFRDIVAFWIFGLANNFAYVIMLSAAEDIIHLQEKGIDSKNSTNYSSSQQCIEQLGKPRCEQLMSTGAILMADILPALLIKFTFPFFMNRIPFGFRHFLVCSLQTFSYLIVAFSTCIEMSLIGVVFASMSSGLGELCYLALSSHYKKSSIAAWSSGTGGAGLIGSLAYALLTEPKMLFALSPKNALLSMLIVPAIFVIAYWFILTPSATVHKMSLLRPSTWIVPKTAAEKKEAAISIISSNSAECSTQSSTTETSKTTQSSTTNSNGTNKVAPMPSNGNGTSAQSATTNEFPLSYKLKLVLPLLRYMIPLSIVYFAEYLINSGLHQLVHFDCSHGFSFALASQFRWYQTLYQFGVFTSRSSVFLFQLPRFGLFLLPFLQCANLVLFYFQALFAFIPHIFIIFLLIYIEGLYGGASYVNTFHRIHKEARPEVREFSMSIASSGDSLGISLASVCSILIHNQICHSYPRIYPENIDL